MKHFSVQRTLEEIEHPLCLKCSAPMWLTRVEHYEPNHDRHTFECQACGSTKVEILKFR